MITFSCECGKRYQVKDELAGKRAKCSCGKSLVIPQPAATATAQTSAQTAAHFPPAPPPVDEQSRTRKLSTRWPLIAGLVTALLIIVGIGGWWLNSARETAKYSTRVVQLPSVGSKHSDNKDSPKKQEPGRTVREATGSLKPLQDKPTRNEAEKESVAVDWRTDLRGLEHALIRGKAIKEGESISWQGKFVRLTEPSDIWAFDGVVRSGFASVEFREVRPNGVIIDPESIKVGAMTVHIWLGCSDDDTQLWKDYKPGDEVEFGGKVVWLHPISTRIAPDGSTWRYGWLTRPSVLRVDSVKPLERSVSASDPVHQSAENAEPKRGEVDPAISHEERSTIEPATDSRKNERDLKLLQGNWRAHKVYWPANTEASALDGGPITIDGKRFVRKEFDSNLKVVDVAWTITRIDATKEPKELDLTRNDGTLTHLVYTVDENRFEYFRPDPGAPIPKNAWFFGREGPFMYEDKGNIYQYVRAE